MVWFMWLLMALVWALIVCVGVLLAFFPEKVIEGNRKALFGLLSALMPHKDSQWYPVLKWTYRAMGIVLLVSMVLACAVVLWALVLE